MGGCIGFIVMLILLSILGWVIDLIVPGKMPYGWLGGIAAAIVGGVIGGFLFGHWGPSVTWDTWELSIIPALLGGIVVAVIIRFIMGSQRRNTV